MTRIAEPRRAALAAPAAVLLAGPTALAFFTGGYFTGPRVWAGALAWACGLAGLALGAPLPRARPAGLALLGMGLLAALSLASIAWAPIAGDAYDAGQIDVLYAGALLAACLVLRAPGARRATEPALAAGAAIVVGYGLAGRLLPGLLHYARSVSAQGRLEQPLTYWNAMGELAALGLVLCVRLAGDRERPPVMRALAAAAGAPLGLGVYASFSRGALFAAGAGLVVLAVLAPRREALRDGGITLLGAALAAAIVSPLHGVTGLEGSLAHRESQGAIALVVVLGLAGAAGVAQSRARARGSEGAIDLDRLGPLARHRGALATGLIAIGMAVAIVVGAHETSGGSASLSGGATRFVTLRSNRYDYWRVALRTFAHHPLAGVGAGNWQVEWLRLRHIDEYAVDAHSLELQTLAELGIAGAIALLGLLLGVALAARRIILAGPEMTGAVAALVVYLAHSPLDWDWQMPALTLVTVILGGAVLAAAGERPEPVAALAEEPATPLRSGAVPSARRDPPP